jgi:ATP-binding cassette subfamily B multidrug efflux pump
MKALAKLLRFIRPYWLWACLAPLLMVGEALLDLMQPRFVRQIIDQGIVPGNPAVVIQTLGWMVAVFVIAALCGAGCCYFAVRASYGMGAALRKAVFEKIQSLSFGNLDRMASSALSTRLTSDTNQVQEMIMMMLRGMVRMPVLLLGSFVMALWISPRLGIVFLVVLPLLVTGLVIILRKAFPLYRDVQHGLDELNRVLQENLAGVRVVKAFARDAHESARFDSANSGLVARMTAAVRMSARTTPVLALILNAGVVGALWIGGHGVYAGEMKVGEVVAFISYLMQAHMALLLFSNLIIQLSRAQASARRLVELLETKPDVKPSDSTIRLADCQGRIVFENVTFSYDSAGKDPVIKNVSFVAEPGQTVALLGATGAGKSSLVQLIPRFYEVTAGRITLDGHDVRDLPETELRAHIGIALQEVILFRTSVGENIGLGVAETDAEEIQASARRAQADEFIQRMPQRYETAVGQRGVNLSGGQKQRMAIARALLPKPTVLILDDSTSAVDLQTEARIFAELAAQPFRQTRFVVAQRVSTVMNADLILVIDDGAIVVQGIHRDLMQSSSIYREIYESQIEQGALVYDEN